MIELPALQRPPKLTGIEGRPVRLARCGGDAEITV